MMKKTELIYFFVGGIIFFTLSWVLFKQVPPSKNHCDVDSGAYIQAANLFLQKSSFAQLQFQPYYGLGYPLLLAGMKKIGNNSIGIIIAIQTLLAWLTTLFIWRISLQLFSRRAALITYILASTNIGLLVFSQFLLTEILLTLLLTIAVERILLFLNKKNFSALWAAGFFLGLSCIVKSVAALFCIVLLPLIFYFAPSLKKLKSAGYFFIAFIVPYIGYQTHNINTFSQQSSSMVTINVCYWYYPHLLAQINKTNSDIERENLQIYKSDKIVWKALKRDIIRYPKEAIIALIKNWTKTLFGLYTTNLKVLISPEAKSGGLSFFRLSGNFFQRFHSYITGCTKLTWIKILGYWEAMLLIINYFFLLLGLHALSKKKHWSVLIFIILYLGYFVGITGHDGCARFRMMSDMIVITLAAGGIEFALKKVRKEE